MKILITTVISIILVNSGYIQNGQKNSYSLDQLNCPERSYKDYFGSPYGIESYYDYYEGLECSKISKKPYLVYFSGHGSLESRQMESEVWTDKEVLNSLKTEFVVTTLYVDDKSKLNIDRQIVSEINGDTIKTYGLKQSYIHEMKFKNNQYPAYYIIDYNEQILAGPIFFDLDRKKFKDFLEQGKTKMKTK